MNWLISSTRNYDSFANQIVTDLKNFKIHFKDLQNADWDSQQNGIGFDYFYKCSYDSIIVSTRLSNHKFIDYSDLTKSDVLSRHIPVNQLIFKKIVHQVNRSSNIFFEKGNWVKFLKLFAENEECSQLRWEPKTPHIFNLTLIMYSKNYKDSKILSAELKTFYDKANAIQEKIKNVFNCPFPDSISYSKDSANSSPIKASSQNFIYTNSERFAENLAFRIYWFHNEEPFKKFGNFSARIAIRGYQLNASNLSGNQRGMLQAVWKSDQPKNLRLFTYMDMHLIRPQEGFPHLKEVCLQKKLNQLNDIIEGVFDKVILSASLQPGSSQLDYSFFWAIRDLKFCDVNLENLIPKISESIHLFSFANEADEKKFEPISKQSKSDVYNVSVEPTQNWINVSKKVLEGFTIFCKRINDNNLLVTPKGWTDLTYKFNYSVGFYEIHCLLTKETKSFEVSLQITPKINLTALNYDQEDKLKSLLLKLGKQHSKNPILIKIQDVGEKKDLSKVYFQTYQKLTVSNENEEFTLAKALQNFEMFSSGIRNELMSFKLSNLIEKTENLNEEPNFSLDVFAYSIGENLKNFFTELMAEEKKNESSSLLKDDAQSMIELISAFNQLKLEKENSFTLSNPNNLFLEYDNKGIHFSFSLMDGIPFLHLSKKIREDLRVFCHSFSDLNVGIVNDKTSANHLFSIVSHKTIDPQISQEELLQELSELISKSESIKSSIK